MAQLGNTDIYGNLSVTGTTTSGGSITNGPLLVNATANTAGSYDEGIRVAVGKNGYSTIVLGSSATSTTGTIDGQWWIGCNHESKPRKLFIAHNGADTSETYFYADASTQKTPSLKVGGTVTANEFVGNVTGNASTISLSNGTADASRYIIFQDSQNSTSKVTACYDADFKYNPVSNLMNVGSVQLNSKVTLQYNSSTESLDFIFA